MFFAKIFGLSYKKGRRDQSFCGKVKALGINIGINVHPTLGFFSGIDADLDNNSKHKNKDGSVNINYNKARITIFSASKIIEEYTVSAENNGEYKEFTVKSIQ